jgi:putative endonuclease
LHSSGHNRFYKGHCGDLTERLKQHNHGHTKSTKPFIPWELVYFEEFDYRVDAVKREKYFKTAAGRRFLKTNRTFYNISIIISFPVGSGGESKFEPWQVNLVNLASQRHDLSSYLCLLLQLLRMFNKKPKKFNSYLII